MFLLTGALLIAIGNILYASPDFAAGVIASVAGTFFGAAFASVLILIPLSNWARGAAPDPEQAMSRRASHAHQLEAAHPRENDFLFLVYQESGVESQDVV